ncbi:hypothetical protein CPB97_002432 [Podila verticillata]|nr:hypothetical protein CPB97_002432 [Podila verticillata]
MPTPGTSKVAGASTSTSKPKAYLAASQLPLTPEEMNYLSKPRVLISGAGIGGLTLAILLIKAGVQCQILEKSYEIKPLGSAMILGTGAGPLLEQLGIYDEFVELAKHATKMDIYNGNLKHAFTMDYGWLEKLPDLYSLLWRYVPRECILLGKRVLSFQDTDDGITVRCSDNSAYEADILVGADGAYSAVRQHMFKTLKATGKLPSVDDVALPFSCVCLVGQTTVLDPEDFPDLKSKFCEYYSILGVQNMCTWLTFTTKRNTVCWMVIQFLTKETAKTNDSFRNSEWGPEAAEAMCKEVRDFKVPGGKDGQVLTLGDYIDRSPKEYIAKVMLEEIVFETWHHGRAVLLGDACHKLIAKCLFQMNPTGAAGALTAMHDAVTLANWICTLDAPSPSEIDDIFKEYRAERYPVAKESFEASQLFTKTLGKRSVSEDDDRPKVLIAGAGIGGLTLALLLKKAGVRFQILERATEIKPLGSAVILGTGVGPLMTQLGIFDEFIQVGKQATEMSIVNENLEPEFKMNYSFLQEATSYGQYIFARPDLHDLLWRHVPRENIHLGKKIVSFDQDEKDVVVRCADGSTYNGHILVGADGAYSAVRQHLFKILKNEGSLSSADAALLPFNSVCLVGQTDVLDPEEFLDLKSNQSEYYSILGDENKCTWLTFTTRKNTVCWMVILFLEEAQSVGEVRTSEWGADAAEAMCEQVRDYKVPGGKDGRVLTLGDYIDRTPKSSIGKLMLEEKMNPTGGAGALTAMHDAVTLANWINTIEIASVPNLETIFKEYQSERHPAAKDAFGASQLFSRILGKSMISLLARAFMKRIPEWLWSKLMIRMSVMRHQASFLPLIESTGTVKPEHQPSLEKTLAILKQQALAKKATSPRSTAVAFV